MQYGAKALRYLDAQQVVASGDLYHIYSLTTALNSVGRAYAGQGDHTHAVETYRRIADILEEFTAQDAADVSRASDYTGALLGLAIQMRNAGNRQGALDTYRRARVVLDQYDSSKITTLSQRQSLASGYRNLSAQFASMNEDAAALATAAKSQGAVRGRLQIRSQEYFQSDGIQSCPAGSRPGAGPHRGLPGSD